MTQEEYKAAQKAGKIAQDPLAELGIETSEERRDGAEYRLEDFLPLLLVLQAPGNHLTAAPTFVPKSLLEAIQFMDDGADRRLYLYINKAWRYVALT